MNRPNKLGYLIRCLGMAMVVITVGVSAGGATAIAVGLLFLLGEATDYAVGVHFNALRDLDALVDSHSEAIKELLRESELRRR